MAVSARARAQGGVLRGVVVDSADGSPLQNVDVLVTALRQARSNYKGQLTLTKLPKGEVMLEVRRIGYKPQFWQGNTSSTLCGTIVVWSRVPGA